MVRNRAGWTVRRAQNVQFWLVVSITSAACLRVCPRPWPGTRQNAWETMPQACWTACCKKASAGGAVATWNQDRGL